MQNNKTLMPLHRKTIVGIQFLFVAFGATVLVPLLVGLDPSVALFTAGVGTLIFHLASKGKVPIFLGSSFAFIAPIQKASELYGMEGTLCGLVAVGFVYFGVSALIKWKGLSIIDKLFPPEVVGPVIILIGLSLAPTAVDMASSEWSLALIAMLVAIVCINFGNKFLKLIPIFAGIIAGYVVALVMGKVDFGVITSQPWFSAPNFVTPSFSWEAILFMIPVAIAPVIEHIGDVYAIGAVTGQDYVKEPGLHRTMFGDGLACTFAGLMGGPPATTYSEVTGAVTLTKVFDPMVLRISAITAILFSFSGKINGFLKSIPNAVLGGIMLILFGMIASIGIKTLTSKKVNIENTRTQIIVALTLTTGIGGAVFQAGNFQMTGIGLAALIGVFLNLLLPRTKN
jgi:uracil permease